MLEKLLELYKKNEGNYYFTRIVSQLKYGYIMSQHEDRKYENILQQTEQFLIRSFENQGALTKEIVTEAELQLQSLHEAAKKYKVICVAHGHIDMNWKWGWDETVFVTLDTFRTMLDLMNEYPDFTYSQSQAAIYRIVEKYDPEMLEEIKKRVKEGRWEVSASTWVEADKNMPTGESHVRQILYAKAYLSSLFGLDPDELNIDFEPDTFGHSANVPEILAQAGVKYYYHCRGYELGHPLYRWQSPSGAQIIVNWDPVFYFNTVDPLIGLYAPDISQKTGLNTSLRLYGVCDHGGGPTRRDIERIIDMNTWPIFPTLEFGNYKTYFAAVESIADQLPVVRGEQNFIFDGCYTSQSRLKEGNRKSEVVLADAELYSSIASVSAGTEYPSNTLNEAWKDVLFNQFHDILPGSGVDETREHAMGLYQNVYAAGGSIQKNALSKITDRIHTLDLFQNTEDLRETISEGAGAGSGQVGRGAGKTRIYHIFNPLLSRRVEVAELMIWNWEGSIDQIVFHNRHGQVIPHQVLDNGFNTYWYHNYLKVLLYTELPAAGYDTVIMTENKRDKIQLSYLWQDRIKVLRVQYEEQFVLENEFLKVTFHPLNGSITSIVDKQTGQERIDANRASGIFRIIDESNENPYTEMRSNMSSWIIGKHKVIESLNDKVEMKIMRGTLRSTLSYKTSFRNSNLKVQVSLSAGSPRLEFHVECDWLENGNTGYGIPQLSFYMPLNYKAAHYKYDVPFGVVERKGTELDHPGNSFVLGYGENTDTCVMLISKSKYGYRCNQDAMSLTLLRSSNDPDPYPEFGRHAMDFALDFVPRELVNHQLMERAAKYIRPLTMVSGYAHAGDLSPECEFFSISEGSIAVSALKMSEEGNPKQLLLRVFETDGQATKATLKCKYKIKHAYFTDLLERRLLDGTAEVQITSNSISFPVAPNRIASLIVEIE
jgi:alpha-mannosidase